MKVFISWSGDRSKHVATALKHWLYDILPDVQPWMSDHDIDAGSRWGTNLNLELQSTHFGILCLTPENLKSSWLLFEAGSLAKALQQARVVPYLFDLTAMDVGFPLAQFQGVNADEQGTCKLLQSLNNAQESSLTSDKLARTFKKWWPDLQTQLERIPPPQNVTEPQRSDRTLLEEILQIVRNKNERSYTALDSQQRDFWHIVETRLHMIEVDCIKINADFKQGLFNISNMILEELRLAYAHHSQVLMWTKSETVYQVMEKDISAMSTSTVKLYLEQVEELYVKTMDSRLKDKIKLAKAEMDRRPQNDA